MRLNALKVLILSRFPIIKSGKLKWTICQSDELLNGAPGFLVTLGLIGTFTGLIQNLSGLSGLLLAGEGMSGQPTLIQGFASIFPSMGAAFITSLAGILLSSSLWLIGTCNGMTGLKDELINLLCGYLEQVVQADCRCYSLVGESLDRMQNYLDDYLSKFSNTVGSQIEHSIDQSIKRLVTALTFQVEEANHLTKTISQGCRDLGKAGHIFFKATEKLEKSDFAFDFSEACSSFIDHTKLLAQTTENIKEGSALLTQQANKLADQISKSCDIYQDMGGVLVQSANALEASKHSALTTTEQLSTAVEAMEGVNRRGMSWLSMRAKTDSKLVVLTEQLQQMLVEFSTVAYKISETTYADFSALRGDLNELKSVSSDLLDEAQRSETEMQLVKAGLQEMAEAPTRLAS